MSGVIGALRRHLKRLGCCHQNANDLQTRHKPTAKVRTRVHGYWRQWLRWFDICSPVKPPVRSAATARLCDTVNNPSGMWRARTASCMAASERFCDVVCFGRCVSFEWVRRACAMGKVAVVPRKLSSPRVCVVCGRFGEQRQITTSESQHARTNAHKIKPLSARVYDGAMCVIAPDCGYIYIRIKCACVCACACVCDCLWCGECISAKPKQNRLIPKIQ